MVGRYPGQVVRMVCVLGAPLIMVFGLYVIAHGHYGPGGGFAGGILVGVGLILLRITVDRELSHRYFPPQAARLLAAIGVLGFVLVGAAALLGGGAYLDYAETPIDGISAVDLRYIGILVVEIFVGFGVTGVMLVLFDALVGDGEP